MGFLPIPSALTPSPKAFRETDPRLHVPQRSTHTKHPLWSPWLIYLLAPLQEGKHRQERDADPRPVAGATTRAENPTRPARVCTQPRSNPKPCPRFHRITVK